jgi:hypothetical protein
LGWSTQEPGGAWTAAYRGPDGLGGRRVFKAGGFRTRKAADDWWKDEEAKLRGGNWLDPRAGEIPLREYFQRFYARKVRQGREAETLRERSATSACRSMRQ